MSKDKQVLGVLLKTISHRDGAERTQQIQAEIKQRVFSALDREIICQVLSSERTLRRLAFLSLYPEYLLPYLFRVREKPAEAKLS